jgi:putative hemolysin
VVIDLSIILVLILLNGFFSGSEMALISLKNSRLQSLLEEGDSRARLLQRLKDNPDNFFATVQIGVTLVTSAASAYGGATLLGHLAPFLTGLNLPMVGPHINTIALATLVFSISYLTLVFGELIPKSLALNYSEGFALTVAYPLHFFSKLFRPFTIFLTVSSNLVLKLFKDKTSFSESRLVEEEIRHLLEEGVQAGTIEHREHEIIQNVFEFNDTSAREIMVPRVDVQALAVDLSPEDIERAMDIPFSRLPVTKEGLDHIVGILHTKDLVRAVARKRNVVLAELVRPAYFVPDSMKIDKILHEMQKRRTHMAIVVDEYGGTAGLLTMEDILEEIVGEIQDITEEPEPKEIVKVAEDTYLVAGSCPTADFNAFFTENELPESESYTSVAGFVIEKLGRFPEVGEKVKVENHIFELSKRIRQKLVQFRVQRLPQVEPEAEAAGK